MTVAASEIEAALREALAPTALAVRDDSHLHAGHAGAAHGQPGGGTRASIARA